MEKSELDTIEDEQLKAYRCLLDNARAMLRAAREERWDDLTALETARTECLQQVMAQDLVSTRPMSVESKTMLIQNILECDEQTRALTHAGREEVGEVLDSMDNGRKLAQAYGGT